METTWLPPGTAKVIELARFYGRQIRVYEVTGPTGEVTRIELQVRSGPDLTPDDGVDTDPRDITLGGRPAREWRKDGAYSVVVRLPGDRVAQVGVFPPRGGMSKDPPDPAPVGRRIATSLRLDRPQPVAPAFRPTYVPKGLAVRAVGRSDALGGTYWTLAAPDAIPQGSYVALGQDPRSGSDPTLGTTPGSGVAGRPVQGHPTHVLTDDGRRALYVDRFRSGQSLVVSAIDALVPVAELYRIADAVR